MTNYESILGWAKEVKALLRQGNLSAVKTNLSVIISQAKEESNATPSTRQTISKPE